MKEIFIVRHESLWETYMKIYKCELIESFDVTLSRVYSKRLVVITKIKRENVDWMFHFFKNIRHSNILCSQECFLYEELIFVFHDVISIFLNHIVVCEVFLNEIKLATILIQISSRRLFLECMTNYSWIDSEWFSVFHESAHKAS